VKKNVSVFFVAWMVFVYTFVRMCLCAHANVFLCVMWKYSVFRCVNVFDFLSWHSWPRTSMLFLLLTVDSHPSQFFHEHSARP
jgi:hypothetical protein